jgi:sodium-dependent multivitamin transporter 6
VVQAALSIFSVFGGPLLGVMMLGIFFPFANAYGALVGLLLSVVLNLTLSITSMLLGKPPTSKPFSIIGCNSTNSSLYENLPIESLFNLTNRTLIHDDRPNVFMVLQLSYLYYSAFAVFIVILIGSVVSLLTGFTKRESLDRNLYIDCLKCFRKKSKWTVVS